MAVYTEVSDEDLKAFASAYDFGAVVGCKGIAEGVENSNYLVETTQGPFILTLYEKRVNPGDLPFFLGLMEHLAAKGVQCPLPVKARDGHALRTLCGRPAAVITFLKGMWPRRAQPEHCAELGRALARMHEAGQSFAMTRPNDLSLEGWRGLFAKTGNSADDLEPGLVKKLSDELAFLSEHWPHAANDHDGLPKGAIHADLFPDNVFFLEGKCSGLIDFYFACTDLLAYDLAICLNAWCFETDGAFNITKAHRLFAHYQAVRKLTAEEKQAMPLLCRGAALRFLLTRLYDWVNTPPGALVKRKDPREYLHKLNFHARVSSLAEYGLS
jgi:homoserine kinase type II